VRSGNSVTTGVEVVSSSRVSDIAPPASSGANGVSRAHPTVNVNIPTPIMLNHVFIVIVILFSLPLLKTSLTRAVLDSFETSPYPP